MTFTNEELVARYQQGENSALDSLIAQNTGLVYSLANRFKLDGTASIDIEDLKQEGFIGLMIAAKKYNLNLKNKAKFSTYAVQWIYQKMHRFITQKNTNKETSLNSPINGEGGGLELGDTIADEVDYSLEVEENLFLKEIREELETAMATTLTLRERQVLKLRYGWDTEPMPSSDIGSLYSINVSSIRHIDARAKARLRKSSWGVQISKEFELERRESVKNVDDIIRSLDKDSEFLEQLRAMHL